jgi:hypothetical protein
MKRVKMVRLAVTENASYIATIVIQPGLFIVFQYLLQVFLFIVH